jgi:DNA-binding transcriptional ArsR family regulator
VWLAVDSAIIQTNSSNKVETWKKNTSSMRSEGLTPAMLADMMGMPANTLSFHLKELMHADLISQERSGRNLIYRAQFDRMNAVLTYLSQNCCQGQPCEVAPEAICQTC